MFKKIKIKSLDAIFFKIIKLFYYTKNYKKTNLFLINMIITIDSV
jgi:hypothetical protein